MDEASDDLERKAPAALPIDSDRLSSESSASRADPALHRRAQRNILVLISAAAILGTLARYAISRILPSQPGHFVWSTFLVNVTGSFVIGFALVLLIERFPRARAARPLIATGFLGAYTTFSTYVVDADLLFKDHELMTGVIYLLASVMIGTIAAFLGIIAGRGVIGVERRLGSQMSESSGL